MTKTFLQAEWRKLAMVNYSIDKKILDKYLPPKTEIDLWNDICYVSLVGFMFKNTKVKGLKIPFHTNFEEVNLRFYVRYEDNGEWKRGVVFVKEIVPKPALTFVANTVYKENYENQRPCDLLSLAIDLDDAEGQLVISDLLQKKVNKERAELQVKETIKKILDRNWMQKREEIKIKIQSGHCSDDEVTILIKQFDNLKRNPPQLLELHNNDAFKSSE